MEDSDNKTHVQRIFKVEEMDWKCSWDGKISPGYLSFSPLNRRDGAHAGSQDRSKSISGKAKPRSLWLQKEEGCSE